MIKTTFPHIGSAYIPLRILLTELGLDPVVPPPISQRTIALGAGLAPEFACLPLKVNLGNYLEALENGAELLLMAGGVGPCRFGLYGEIQREILKDAGYEPQFLVLEAPKTDLFDLLNKIRRFMPRHKLGNIKNALSLAWLKAEALDRFDRLANTVRPIETIPGTTNQLQSRFYTEIDQAMLKRDIKERARRGITELEQTSIRSGAKPLRVVLLGEIYMVLEEQVNFKIEKLLGALGVEVKRTIYFTDWIRDQLVMSIFNPHWRAPLFQSARPYLHDFVGGHGLETVAHTVDAALGHNHGVIQLAPFTCMPEIVAMQVLPAVTRDLGIPVLSLIIDEHAAEAGIRTRLEAFVDLLTYRNKQQFGGKKLAVVSGH